MAVATHVDMWILRHQGSQLSGMPNNYDLPVMDHEIHRSPDRLIGPDVKIDAA